MELQVGVAGWRGGRACRMMGAGRLETNFVCIVCRIGRETRLTTSWHTVRTTLSIPFHSTPLHSTHSNPKPQ